MEGEDARIAAMHNAPPAFTELRQRMPVFRPPEWTRDPNKQYLHIADCSLEPAYHQRHPGAVAMVELAGARTLLGVPLLKDGAPIGYFALYRQEVRLFGEKQIELLQNFAAQAVIAIENARLLNELRQRTSDLTQALEQQTATSEVLQVITSSPGNLQPVFASMLQKALQICEAKFGMLALYEEDDLWRTVAVDPTSLTENASGSKWGRWLLAEPRRFGPETALGRLAQTRELIHIPDLGKDVESTGVSPTRAAFLETGARTLLAAPLLKEGKLIGTISFYRQELRPFTDKQTALIENFAAQAVIAIENARLLNELRQRTTDLLEALRQQTATSEVLQTISTSPGDLEPVFAAMLEKAVGICGASFGNIYRWDGTLLHIITGYNTPPEYVEYRKRTPFRADNPFHVARMINSKSLVHTSDFSDEVYAEAVQIGKFKTMLCVPMLKDDDLIGAIIVARSDVRPFTDKQIALVQNFAAQAVIAIENTRLLRELRERTEQVEQLNRHLEQRVVDQVDEIERVNRLRRFLPPQVADLIVASGSEKQLESHRREITALFCDLRGFTGFTESADAEDVMALLRDYHAAIGELVIKYSGTLERYAGDGVMVIFNDPVPVENPALQGVLMALEMRGSIGALTDKWRRLGHDIGFGIGIAHGFATLGTIGFEGRFDYAAIGTVSNVASRLCDEAKASQILISPRVLMAVEDAVLVEAVGEFALKGIRRPLAAYNVVGTKLAN
jgi:GAF domain-containing protein